MNRRTLGITLLVVGLVVFLVALGADLVGLGGAPSLGPTQVTAAIIGAAVAIAGVLLRAVRA
jgi:hypothetical protein